MTIVFIVMALITGSLMVVQAGVNGQVRLRIGDPWQAAFISTSISTMTLFIISGVSARRPLPQIERLFDAPWWIWTGGLMGAFIVAATLFLVSKLGGGVLFALIVTGQMAVALVIDHYGLLGVPIHHVNGQRVVGVVLLLIGVALIRVF